MSSSEAGCAATDMTGLLVGYGSIGRRHLANLHGLGVGDWAVVHTGAGTLPFEPPCAVRSYSDLSSALEAEEPAFAVIANPTRLRKRRIPAERHAGQNHRGKNPCYEEDRFTPPEIRDHKG